MSSEDVAKQFVAAINQHDADKLYKLMSEDHTFIDSDGTSYSNTDQYRQGWIEYFKMFPDYMIDISEVFSSGDTVVLLGKASGTYTSDGSLKPENQWQVPAAWKAVIAGEKVKVWQIFVNPEPIAKVMERSSKD